MTGEHDVPLHWIYWPPGALVSCTCGETFSRWDDAAYHQTLNRRQAPPSDHA